MVEVLVTGGAGFIGSNFVEYALGGAPRLADHHAGQAHLRRTPRESPRGHGPSAPSLRARGRRRRGGCRTAGGGGRTAPADPRQCGRRCSLAAGRRIPRRQRSPAPAQRSAESEDTQPGSGRRAAVHRAKRPAGESARAYVARVCVEVAFSTSLAAALGLAPRRVTWPPRPRAGGLKRLVLCARLPEAVLGMRLQIRCRARRG